MKKILKNNWFILLSILLLITWFLFGLFKFLDQYYEEVRLTNQYYSECEKIDFQKDICKDIKTNKEGLRIPPAPLLFIYILTGSSSLDSTFSLYYLPIFAILFVIIPSMLKFYIDIHSGNYKNKLLRQNYFSFLKTHYKQSLKSAWILPIFFLVSFLIICFVSHFNFQYLPGEMELGGSIFYSSGEYVRSLWLPYFLVILFCLFTHSIYYINMAYIMFFKAKNFLIGILKTFLSYLITQTLFVSLFQYIIGKLLKCKELALAISDPEIWIFGAEITHFEYMFYIAIIYVIISFFLFIIVYHKKEKLVISNE